MSLPRFLFFLYYFPPLQGTPPKRNHQVASEISHKTAFSRIFTSTEQAEAIVENGHVQIQTIPASDYRSYLRTKSVDGALPEEKKESWWMQMMVKLINTFPINILIGEGGLFYFLRLMREGHRAIRTERITHIYSSYRPFTDHYAAYRLKKKHPRLIWIADFRDLIIDPHYNHIFSGSSQQLFFKRIFKRADVLTTVSDGLAKHLREYNPNVLTIRNGIIRIPESIPETHCKYFKIAYTGSMFLDKRNAEPVFLALQSLIEEKLVKEEEFRFIYAGKDSFYWNEMAAKYEMQHILVNKGIVPGDEALKIQLDACINLLLTVSSDELQGVLTGKMIELFESGSPVLAIVVNKNDPELKNMLEELEIGHSFSDNKTDANGIREFIFQEYLHWKKNGTNRKAVNLEALKRKYSVEETMRPLFEFLKV